MSMNIAPQITQVVVNAAAPTTEALARSNANREAVPATVKTEAYVPQKSREQEARNPLADEDPGTYEDIRSNITANNQIIAEDEQNSEQNTSQQDPDNSEASTASSDESQNEEGSEQEQSSESREQAQEQQQQAQEQRVIDQLKSRDREVRAHEQAHAAVGGSLAGAPSYDYQTGPDGKKYAVGGEVSIDVSKTNDPEQTIQKMQTVRAAALAPAEPSSQDRKVAAQASRNIAEARAELVSEQSEINNPERTQESPEVNVEGAEQTNNEASVSNQGDGNALASSDNNSSNSEQSAVTAPSTSSASGNNQNETANLAKRFVASDNEDKTAQVVSQRYAASYQRSENFFTAVA